MKKKEKKYLIYGAIVLGIILLIWFLSGNGIYLNNAGNNTSGGGGGGSGGSGGNNPLQSPCQTLASQNGYAHYQSPIGTQMACSVLAFSSCSNSGQVYNNGAWNDNLDCCMWNCKSSSDNGGGQTPNCVDSDGGIKPFDVGHVDVQSLAVSYPDACTNEAFNRYLHEWYCENGVAKMTTIDCWGTYGAICGNGACHTPSCESIINPQGQSDCDKGQPCTNTGEETYCKFNAGGVGGVNRCVCTIDPSTINSCERACWFAGWGSGYCYIGQISKNPCGTSTYSQEGSEYCDKPQLGLPTCCCR